MTSQLRISLCRGPATVLLLAVLCVAPRGADAAPILGGVRGVPCTLTPPDPADPPPPPEPCGLFTIDGVSQTLAGEFEFDNDAAWFQFLLGPGTFTLTGATTSAAAGFDPILKLFGPDGAPVPYLSDGVESTSPVSGEIDADIQLPEFTLTGGLTYTLTLSQFGPLFGNFPKDTLEEGFEFDAPEFRCFFNVTDPAAPCFAGAPDLFGGQSGSFSLDLTVTSADTAPIPEPGTLSLVALGSLGAAVMRRRSARRRASRP